MMKQIVTLALIIFVSVHLAGQTIWEKHESPVLVGEAGGWDENIVSPAVIKLEDTYHMWYTGLDPSGVRKIGYATSSDGITWENYENNPVLVAGPLESFDDRNPYLPIVVFDDTVFHMYYVGTKSNGNEYLFYATSGDGISWEKQGRPAFQDENGDPVEIDVNRGDVYFDGEVFHMWAGMDNSGKYNVGYATSDDGATWTVVNPLVMEVPPSFEWDYPRTQVATVFEMEGLYHMWYSGGGLFNWDIGYATSPDGLTWTRYEGNPVLTRGEPGSWDEEFVAFPTVIWDPSDTILKMWYTASFLEGRGIGYAEQSTDTSTTGFNFLSVSRKNALVLYPNPATTWVTIETGQHYPASLEIISLNGQILHQEKFNGQKCRIDLSALDRGLYLIKVRSETGVRRAKLVIE